MTKLFAQYGNDATLDCFVKTLSSQEDRLSSEEVLYRAFIAESGEFAGGDGSAENPYLIYTAEQMKSMGNGEGKHYLLKSHLTLPENEYLPGSFSGSLKGDVDGQRAVVTLQINLPDAVGVGLFAGTGAGTIENICVAGSIIGSNNVGGIAGSGTGTRFINCFNTADITATANKLSNQNDNGCNVAGIVGSKATSNSVIRNCFNTGTVYAGIENAGGIMGREYNVKNGKVTLENCYNTGSISVQNKAHTAAGLVGALGHTAAGRANLLDIRNSYTVTENGLGAVGVKNHAEHTLTMENTYYISDAANVLPEELAGKKLGSSDMKEGLPEGFDSAVWIYEAGFEYPQLISNPHVSK